MDMELHKWSCGLVQDRGDCTCTPVPVQSDKMEVK
jgi:hypothetical protein